MGGEICVIIDHSFVEVVRMAECHHSFLANVVNNLVARVVIGILRRTFGGQIIN